MKKEVWKSVVGFKGYYEVSNKGRVRSLDRKINGPHGIRFAKGKIISPIYLNGYSRLSLCKKGKCVQSSIHRIVMHAFKKRSSLTVNHKDENKSNNELQNLEYMSRKDNLNYSQRMNEDARNDVRRLYKNGLLKKDIAMFLEVDRKTIYNILNYRH